MEISKTQNSHLETLSLLITKLEDLLNNEIDDRASVRTIDRTVNMLVSLNRAIDMQQVREKIENKNKDRYSLKEETKSKLLTRLDEEIKESKENKTYTTNIRDIETLINLIKGQYKTIL